MPLTPEQQAREDIDLPQANGVPRTVRDGDDLWTHDGRHVGRFDDSEVYGPSGLYLGEQREDRLLTKTKMKGSRGHTFSPRMNRMGRIRRMNRMARMMRMGYEDFA